MKWEVIRGCLEALSFLASPLLVYCAFKALTQVKVAKDTLEINSKRSAAIVAAQQMDVFQGKIIELIDNLDGDKDAKSIKLTRFALERFSADEVAAGSKELKAAYATGFKYMIADRDVQKLHLKAANAIEAVAIYFVGKIADENIAYTPVHDTLIHFVERYFYFYVHMRSAEGSTYFDNTIQLYRRWKERGKREMLTIKKEQIDRELEGVNEVSPMNPIGVKER